MLKLTVPSLLSPSGEAPRDALVCVPPAQVAAIWPHVAPFIESAFLSGRGDDTAETVLADLVAGNSLLWIVWDGSGLIAAATTKIIDAPAKRICVVTSCAGREMPRWISFIDDLARYAADEGCAVLRVEGREGWKATLPGFRQPFVVLERSL